MQAQANHAEHNKPNYTMMSVCGIVEILNAIIEGHTYNMEDRLTSAIEAFDQERFAGTPPFRRNRHTACKELSAAIIYRYNSAKNSETIRQDREKIEETIDTLKEALAGRADSKLQEACHNFLMLVTPELTAYGKATTANPHDEHSLFQKVVHNHETYDLREFFSAQIVLESNKAQGWSCPLDLYALMKSFESIHSPLLVCLGRDGTMYLDPENPCTQYVCPNDLGKTEYRVFTGASKVETREFLDKLSELTHFGASMHEVRDLDTPTDPEYIIDLGGSRDNCTKDVVLPSMNLLQHITAHRSSLLHTNTSLPRSQVSLKPWKRNRMTSKPTDSNLHNISGYTPFRSLMRVAKGIFVVWQRSIPLLCNGYEYAPPHFPKQPRSRHT